MKRLVLAIALTLALVFAGLAGAVGAGVIRLGPGQKASVTGTDVVCFVKTSPSQKVNYVTCTRVDSTGDVRPGSYVVALSPKFVLVGQADAKRNIKTVFQRTGTP